MPWFYIMASQTRTLYCGVTRDITQRVGQHREGCPGSFCSRYRITRLVYCEYSISMFAVIQREKQVKGWSREKRLRLVETLNPEWEDLALRWGTLGVPQTQKRHPEGA